MHTKCFLSYISLTWLYFSTISPLGMSSSILTKHFVERDCLIIPLFLGLELLGFSDFTNKATCVRVMAFLSLKLHIPPPQPFGHPRRSPLFFIGCSLEVQLPPQSADPPFSVPVCRPALLFHVGNSSSRALPSSLPYTQSPLRA